MEHINLTVQNFFEVGEAEAFKSQTQELGETSSRPADNKLGVGSLKDRKERVEESELQPSRPSLNESIRRKSSEHKDPYSSDSLTDMETMAWPEWEQTPYNWENYGGYPNYAYYPPESSGYAGWGPPRGRYNWYRQPYPEEAAEELLYLKGCAFGASPGIITDCSKEYSYGFSFLAGDIVGIHIDGPATYLGDVKISQPENVPESIANEEGSYSDEWYAEHQVVSYDKYPPDIIIKPYEDAEYGSTVTITVFTKLVQNDMAYDGMCTKEIDLLCGCRDAVPEIYATGDAMGASDSLDMWVDSHDFLHIYAVPPFNWSLSGGEGFSLSKMVTTEEYEVNVLSTNADACGSAVITVTDNCDISDEYSVRCTDSGQWVEVSGCSTPGVGDVSIADSGDWNVADVIDGNMRYLERYCSICPEDNCFPDYCGQVGEKLCQCVYRCCEARAACGVGSYPGQMNGPHPSCPGAETKCNLIARKTYEWKCAP